jgi:thiol-disulfide isomerase/thioredoxin
MRRWCTCLLVLLPAALLLPFALPSKDAPKAELTLKNQDGKRVRLSELRGKPVVLNFWATWCQPCNAEMPMLVEAEKTYGSRGVVFLAASLDEAKTKAAIPAFVSKYAIPFPVWVGATGDDLDRLQMGPAVPATAFIDPEGRIVARVMGQMREDEMKERLEWLAGPRTGPAPQAIVKHLEK